MSRWLERISRRLCRRVLVGLIAVEVRRSVRGRRLGIPVPCRRSMVGLVLGALRIIRSVHYDPPAAAAAGVSCCLSVLTLVVTLLVNLPMNTSKKLSAL
jgi:hypothetical protein